MMPTWNDFITAEPRLAALLEAATALVGHNHECHAEAVYVMTKPLIGWLVGPGRGRNPRNGLRGVPAGTRLWAMATVARPFNPEPSWLDSHHAYDHVRSHINELLHRVQQRKEAA
ncbi:hypothetical protein GCM10010399_44180 [Dactylosporangium fulvum]|uniref:Uncharacterized protein n=1 Tax=Dactylosporangium fulvum TaxID=53359 RepID=A0ABY5W8V3_9ACTN|nr:hypothetical protein [Dactylosporangium fulvum]UWP85914.1 hypothetical protein Dfulv_17345 [Dactylosporangium fulvum]